MAVSTYYFDGHNGISDPDLGWINDAYAFDGNTGTVASTTDNEGAEDFRELKGIGTNAPTVGGAISQVRARVYRGEGATSSRIYTASEAEVLATITSSSMTGWTDYTTLSTPSGGWDWATVRLLEVANWHATSGPDSSGFIAKIELEVTHEEIATDVTTYYFDRHRRSRHGLELR